LCVESNDKELFKEEKVRFSLILDTDQDDLDGKLLFFDLISK